MPTFQPYLKNFLDTYQRHEGRNVMHGNKITKKVLISKFVCGRKYDHLLNLAWPHWIYKSSCWNVHHHLHQDLFSWERQELFWLLKGEVFCYKCSKFLYKYFLFEDWYNFSTCVYYTLIKWVKFWLQKTTLNEISYACIRKKSFRLFLKNISFTWQIMSKVHIFVFLVNHQLFLYLLLRLRSMKKCMLIKSYWKALSWSTFKKVSYIFIYEVHQCVHYVTSSGPIIYCMYRAI